MKLIDVILITLSTFFVIVGIHQTFLHGFFSSYVFFMMVIILMGIFQLRKKPVNKPQEPPKDQKKKSRKPKI
jgi:uncharacterized membrane protein YhaH (DUF805 family)